MSDAPAADVRPWWQFGHVWLVLSGPLTVVIASFFTFYLAAVGSDPLVDENYYQKGVEINRTLADTPQSMAPAIQARNHAATGVEAPKEPYAR
jgi:hypothetical protein